MILLIFILIYLLVAFITYSEKPILRVIVMSICLVTLLITIAILAEMYNKLSACEADSTYGEKCVLQAIPVHTLGD